MMELEKFMRAHYNWEYLLERYPYYISTKWDNGYALLKYNHYASDFNLPLVREARGSIFCNKVCVCRGFDKFGNWGEKYAETSNINWNSAKVMEKIDGSLIRVWYHLGEWHISTNGTIYAENAICPNPDYNFKSLFELAIARIPNFWGALNPTYCYMFELTSPYAQIVVPYNETEIWYLGRRNMVTGLEDNEVLELEGLRHPDTFPLHSLNDCIAIATLLDENHEGFVVVDDEFRRIKIKGDEYLKRHYARINGNFTSKKIFEMWKNDTLDDFLAYFPNSKQGVAKIVSSVEATIASMELAWNNISFSDRKSFAAEANKFSYPINGYLFARLDNKVGNAREWLKKYGQWKGEVCCDKN